MPYNLWSHTSIDTLKKDKIKKSQIYYKEKVKQLVQSKNYTATVNRFYTMGNQKAKGHSLPNTEASTHAVKLQSFRLLKKVPRRGVTTNKIALL